MPNLLSNAQKSHILWLSRKANFYYSTLKDDCELIKRIQQDTSVDISSMLCCDAGGYIAYLNRLVKRKYPFWKIKTPKFDDVEKPVVTDSVEN